jgi:hypothetical protein
VPVEFQWSAVFHSTKSPCILFSPLVFRPVLLLILMLLPIKLHVPFSSTPDIHPSSGRPLASLQPMPLLHLQAHLPEVSAACCLTAALSRLKALSAGPSRPFAWRCGGRALCRLYCVWWCEWRGGARVCWELSLSVARSRGCCWLRNRPGWSA